MTYPTVYLCRHGETQWSKSGQHTGTTDLALTEQGLKETGHLRKRLKKVSFKQVLCSPRLRAQQTCHKAGFSGVVWDDLAEWDYGDYEGKTTAAIRRGVPDWSIFTHGAPRGESPKEMEMRVDRVIARLRGMEGSVALFSHGHFLRVLGARWIGLPLAGGAHLDLGTAALCVLGFVREVPALVLWNETPHLMS